MIAGDAKARSRDTGRRRARPTLGGDDDDDDDVVGGVGGDAAREVVGGDARCARCGRCAWRRRRPGWLARRDAETEAAADGGRGSSAVYRARAR